MPRAVILTALPVEYLAVRTHLTKLQEEMHPQGTIYERGEFSANGQTWEVGIAEVGAGNAGAAIEAERAIAYFKPDVLLFVGIAGGIKDVAIGDVVAATDVYGYESGKVGSREKFSVRPKAGKSSYAIVQRARSEARKTEWIQRLSNSSLPQPNVFVAPIAAGEKVIASRNSKLFQFLRDSYNDALAVEMEGFGFLSAAFAYPNIKAIVIRGISDLIKDKNAEDPVEGTEDERQRRAAHNASAFAFEVVAKFMLNDISTTDTTVPEPHPQIRFIDHIYPDPITIADTIRLFEKGVTNVSIEWPKSTYDIFNAFDQFTNSIADLNGRPTEFINKDLDEIANLYDDFCNARDHALQIMKGVSERFPITWKSIHRYSHTTNITLKNFLILSNFQIVFGLIVRIRRYALTIGEKVIPRDFDAWQSFENYHAIMRKNFGMLFKIEEEIYDVEVLNIDGVELKGMLTACGSRDLILAAREFSDNRQPIHNSWYWQHLVPQVEIRLVIQDSKLSSNYNEMALLGIIHNSLGEPS